MYYASSRFYGIAEIMKQEASAPNIAMPLLLPEHRRHDSSSENSRRMNRL